MSTDEYQESEHDYLSSSDQCSRRALQAISLFVSTYQKDWDSHIPSFRFAYRVTNSESTCDSPFYLMYGREPVLPPDVLLLTQ